MTEDPNSEFALGKYFAGFTALLLTYLLLVWVLRTYFNVQITGVAMIAPFLSALVVTEFFVSRQKRAPSDDERKKLVKGGLGISLFATGCILLALVSGRPFQALMRDPDYPLTQYMIVWGSVLAAALVLNGLMMWWAYGGIAKRRAAKLGFTEDS